MWAEALVITKNPQIIDKEKASVVGVRGKKRITVYVRGSELVQEMQSLCNEGSVILFTGEIETQEKSKGIFVNYFVADSIERLVRVNEEKMNIYKAIRILEIVDPLGDK